MTLPIIERRRIEAEILGHVYEVMRARVGEQQAKSMLGEAVSRSAIEQARRFREALGRTPDLSDLAGILPNWTTGGSLELEVKEATSEKLEFNVTRCRYAEMYREMGLSEIGHLLSCNRDGDFCVGYNPDIELRRSQTIMQGASHCDFRYRLVTAGARVAQGGCEGSGATA